MMCKVEKGGQGRGYPQNLSDDFFPGGVTVANFFKKFGRISCYGNKG